MAGCEGRFVVGMRGVINIKQGRTSDVDLVARAETNEQSVWRVCPIVEVYYANIVYARSAPTERSGSVSRSLPASARFSPRCSCGRGRTSTSFSPGIRRGGLFVSNTP